MNYLADNFYLGCYDHLEYAVVFDKLKFDFDCVMDDLYKKFVPYEVEGDVFVAGSFLVYLFEKMYKRHFPEKCDDKLDKWYPGDIDFWIADPKDGNVEAYWRSMYKGMELKNISGSLADHEQYFYFPSAITLNDFMKYYEYIKTHMTSVKTLPSHFNKENFTKTTQDIMQLLHIIQKQDFISLTFNHGKIYDDVARKVSELRDIVSALRFEVSDENGKGPNAWLFHRSKTDYVDSYTNERFRFPPRVQLIHSIVGKPEDVVKDFDLKHLLMYWTRADGLVLLNGCHDALINKKLIINNKNIADKRLEKWAKRDYKLVV